MAVAGGLRSRLIRDSLQMMVRESLDARGWFDPDRRHEPLKFVTEYADWDIPIAFNSIVISISDTNDDPVELGSNLTEDSIDVYIDFYAESDTLGIDVIHDVRDILRGKLSVIGRTRSSLDVYDLTLATPVVIFKCEIEDVVVDRATGFNRPHLKHWWSARCTLLDTWTDDSN